MNRAPRTVLLPGDLDSSLALLDDAEFERLIRAVAKEEARRHRNKPVSARPSKDLEGEAPNAGTSKGHSEPISPAKASLVRAALKAGVKPSAIARQFGLSHAAIADVLRSGQK